MSLFSYTTNSSIESDIELKIKKYKEEFCVLIETTEASIERRIKGEFLSGIIFAYEEMKRDLKY